MSMSMHTFQHSDGTYPYYIHVFNPEPVDITAPHYKDLKTIYDNLLESVPKKKAQKPVRQSMCCMAIKFDHQTAVHCVVVLIDKTMKGGSHILEMIVNYLNTEQLIWLDDIQFTFALKKHGHYEVGHSAITLRKSQPYSERDKKVVGDALAVYVKRHEIQGHPIIIM